MYCFIIFNLFSLHSHFHCSCDCWYCSVYHSSALFTHSFFADSMIVDVVLIHSPFVPFSQRFLFLPGQLMLCCFIVYLFSVLSHCLSLLWPFMWSCLVVYLPFFVYSHLCGYSDSAFMLFSRPFVLCTKLFSAVGVPIAVVWIDDLFVGGFFSSAVYF